MQEVPLQVVVAEDNPSGDTPKSNPLVFRISIWRFLCCTLPIVLCAVVSIISVHVCKNQGFPYGAGIAAVCAIGVYIFNLCLVAAMVTYLISLRCPFCTDAALAKSSNGTTAINAINIFNLFLSIVLAVVVICIVTLEHRRYYIGEP
ncbi:uncharacterized protein LOC110466826 [Mizuhopecten yessoensis]|uniref:Uncharacterized protein n=1 Tax=Mizuhopecten yessoensis TaxID=6573 RepID=A0A210PNH4_MIZYE|nr:uncharacterized protein LOC110466826 [Mizuhopecten yessoensis]OWF37996.1 hypothetical protein KP79_PYT14316 [Mizuhopecten yessoensis]